jgi:hypothetical protein
MQVRWSVEFMQVSTYAEIEEQSGHALDGVMFK